MGSQTPSTTKIYLNRWAPNYILISSSYIYSVKEVLPQTEIFVRPQWKEKKEGKPSPYPIHNLSRQITKFKGTPKKYEIWIKKRNKHTNLNTINGTKK